MIKILVLAMAMTSCQWPYQQQPEPVITPQQCKRACYPGIVKRVDTLDGACECQRKRR